MEREVPAPISPEGEEHPPKYTIEKITRSDGTTAEEAVEEGEIPITKRLIITTPEGKKKNLFDFSPQNTIGLSAERVLAAAKEGSSQLKPILPIMEQSVKSGGFFIVHNKDEALTLLVYPNLASLKEPGGVADILHEFGHPKKGEDQEFAERKRGATAAILVNASATAQKRNAHKTTIAVPVNQLYTLGLVDSHGYNFLISSLREQVTDPRKIVLPEQVVRRAFQIAAEEERGAWAFALNTIRNLRKEGCDLEPNLNLDEIREEAYGALRTHEAASPIPEELFTKGKPVGFSRFVRWYIQDHVQRERILAAGNRALATKGQKLFNALKGFYTS